MTNAEKAEQIHADAKAQLATVMSDEMAVGFIAGALMGIRITQDKGPLLGPAMLLKRAAELARAEAPALARKMRDLDRAATAYSRGRVAHGEGEIEVAPRDEDDPESWRRGWMGAKAEAEGSE